MDRFAVKLIANGAVAVPLLVAFTEAGFAASLLTASALSVLAWLIGDRLILPLTNNPAATMADAVLVCAFLWFVADMMDWTLAAGELLVMTAAPGVAEWGCHRFLENLDRART